MEPDAVERVFGTMFAFCTGACVGSFLNVCIYRWPLGLKTGDPKRSICFHCEREIPWHDNIPILSWLILRGRCRFCGEAFSPRYAVVELLTAVLFVHVFRELGWVWATPLIMVWVAMQIVGSFIDFDHTIIPDRITLTGSLLFPLGVTGLDLLGRTEGLAVPDWQGSLFGAFFGASFIYTVRFTATLAFGREAMGLGDVKLMAMNGALLGWWRSLLVIMGFAPFLALATVGAGMLLSRFKPARYQEIPFGPYLCLGSYLAFFWARDLVEWWMDLPDWYLDGMDRPWRWWFPWR